MNNYYDVSWIRNMNPTYSSNLCTPKDGYLKGNMFKDLYSPYKNYQPMILNPRSEKEKKFLELSEVSFAAHELNLYLDLHPDDQSMFLLFKDYQKKEKELKEEYESYYGPLCVDSEMNNFSWVSSEWPWEGNNV